MSAADIEIRALAEVLADVLTERGLVVGAAPPRGRVLDGAGVAVILGRDRQWVYDHADELGAFRYGDGPRARLGFDAVTVEQWKRTRRPALRADPARSEGLQACIDRGVDPVRGVRPRDLGFATMGRRASGSLRSEIVADGTRAFHLRFTANGRRQRDAARAACLWMRLRWRLDRAYGRDRARERPRSRPGRGLAQAAPRCALRRAHRGSDVSRVRV